MKADKMPGGIVARVPDQMPQLMNPDAEVDPTRSVFPLKEVMGPEFHNISAERRS
jgi:hypothetical protein